MNFLSVLDHFMGLPLKGFDKRLVTLQNEERGKEVVH